MRHYEAAYYLFPNLDEGAIQALNEKFSSHVNQLGGQEVKVNVQGKKRLAYPVKGQQEGHFVVLEFHGEPTVAKELGRILRIADEVLRSMVVSLN